jgi:hypothetical protein
MAIIPFIKRCFGKDCKEPSLPAEEQLMVTCICGKEFIVNKHRWVLPNHTDIKGKFCNGSFVLGCPGHINLLPIAIVRK